MASVALPAAETDSQSKHLGSDLARTLKRDDDAQSLRDPAAKLRSVPADPASAVLNWDKVRQYVADFNAVDDEPYQQFVPNAQAAEFLADNIPRFECPDADFERTWYFRWWTFRKHIKETPDGFVVTEFLPPVKWAGKYNTINCAAAFHFNEGRWLRDPRFLRDYAIFWLRQSGAGLRAYTFWPAESIWNFHLVHPDTILLKDLLPDLVKNYRGWEKEHRDADGLFWQSDTRDGGEISAGGHGKRPTINSAMYGEARAIARIARLAGDEKLAAQLDADADLLRKLVQAKLWNPHTQFFHTMPFPVQHRIRPDQPVVDPAARELIGFMPWYFELPEASHGYEAAWAQVMDWQGFYAQWGLTTTEQRHPLYRVSFQGHPCQWCGPVWPFSSSLALKAMANVLRDYPQNTITANDYFELLRIYTKSHQRKLVDGRVIPWIDEDLDPQTGVWIARERLKAMANGAGTIPGHGPVNRGKDYNHSAYCDLIVSGLVGLIPRTDDTVEVNPLLPAGTWDWFCLDGVPYHGRMLTILWDKPGTRYGKGTGLRIFADGRKIAAAPKLQRLTGELPPLVPETEHK